ncbi:MAG TPA: sialidase family protein, partial [Acidimicrobiales bacterium]|nr:sialidase family protein [Acidimicrobiales bacterium]
GDPGRLAVQPTLLAGPGGQVVVGALDLGQDLDTYQTRHEGRSGPPPAGPWQVILWRSTDGGATFGPAITVAGSVVPSQRVLIDLAPAPAFALDPPRSRVYAAWETGRDVMVARSDDAGASWSPPRRLGPSAGGQFLPGIDIAPDGRVDVAYYDRSRDPDDVLAEVVLASSTDGARSFVDTVISERPFDSQVGSFNGDDVMLGSHTAVISRAEDAVVVWPDTTRGNRTTNIVDLVSARVEIGSASGARVPLVAGGALLALAGLVASALSWRGRAARPDRRPARRRAASPPPALRG